MIQIWNTPIATSIEQVLSDLRLMLYPEGLLRDQNNTGSDIMVTCPFHKGGHEKKPSCGVSLREKKTPERVYEAGTVHCYTCGYTADLPTFIKDLLGLDNAMEGFRWLVGRYNYSVSEREEISFNFYRGETEEQRAAMDTAQIEAYHLALMNSEKAMSYLRGRAILPEVMRIYNLGFDTQDQAVLFPVYARSGEVLFIKSRSITGKHFFNAKDIDKTAAVYGLYQLEAEGVPGDVEVWLTESEIDALSLISKGYAAVAIMGSHISEKQVRELIKSPYRRYVIATDNDDAGRKGARLIKDKLIPYGFRFYNLKWLTDAKDVNELIQAQGEDFTDFLTRY